MIRPIIIWPNPFLKTKSVAVDFDLDLYSDVANDMIDTMLHEGGVGLAAVQIGVGLRIITLNAGHGPEVWINPKIIRRSPEKERMPEGCLSLPGITEDGARNVWVDVVGYYVSGHLKGTHAVGLRAQVFAHEIEHLDGRMYVDKMEVGFKDRLRKRLKKGRGGF